MCVVDLADCIWAMSVVSLSLSTVLLNEIQFTSDNLRHFFMCKRVYLETVSILCIFGRFVVFLITVERLPDKLCGDRERASQQSSAMKFQNR